MKSTHPPIKKRNVKSKLSIFDKKREENNGCGRILNVIKDKTIIIID